MRGHSAVGSWGDGLCPHNSGGFQIQGMFTWILKVVGQFPGVERENPPGRDSTSAKVRKSRTRLRNRNSLLVWVEFRIFNGV